MSAECKQCEARVIPWLTEHMEAWHGPKDQWPEHTRNEFYERSALLYLFAQDFHFPQQPKEAKK